MFCKCLILHVTTVLWRDSDVLMVLGPYRRLCRIRTASMEIWRSLTDVVLPRPSFSVFSSLSRDHGVQ